MIIRVPSWRSRFGQTAVSEFEIQLRQKSHYILTNGVDIGAVPNPQNKRIVDLESHQIYDLLCRKNREPIMPKGPQGQKRPADAVGAAIMVAKIATGKVEEVLTMKSGRSRSGKAGAKGRAESLTQEARHEIAKKAAMARWER